MADYYREHFDDYVSDTLNADMTELYGYFVSHLGGSAKKILDLGCGSGRDALFFQSSGYDVTAVDPLEEFCEHAKSLGIKDVRRVRAEELDFEDEFDGIWACASLLHVEPKDLNAVFVKCARALKNGGVTYCSFKYGEFAGEKNGRFFHDLTEESFPPFIEGTGLAVEDVKITSDVRAGRRSERWLNVILKKI